jgi:hypothetical protein
LHKAQKNPNYQSENAILRTFSFKPFTVLSKRKSFKNAYLGPDHGF